jgi:hypothetical protein
MKFFQTFQEARQSIGSAIGQLENLLSGLTESNFSTYGMNSSEVSGIESMETLDGRLTGESIHLGPRILNYAFVDASHLGHKFKTSGSFRSEEIPDLPENIWGDISSWIKEQKVLDEVLQNRYGAARIPTPLPPVAVVQAIRDLERNKILKAGATLQKGPPAKETPRQHKAGGTGRLTRVETVPRRLPSRRPREIDSEIEAIARQRHRV